MILQRKIFKEADVDDAFGVEEGGFCNFSNSILIIYLWMWLNERPGLVNFVSRQILGPMQLMKIYYIYLANRELEADGQRTTVHLPPTTPLTAVHY